MDSKNILKKSLNSNTAASWWKKDEKIGVEKWGKGGILSGE